jgi:hypothetical protein
MNNFMSMMSQLNAFKSNPAQMLLQSGKITQDQYKAMQGMSPSQMGNYMLNNGIIGGDQFGQLRQAASELQKFLGTNAQ